MTFFDGSENDDEIFAGCTHLTDKELRQSIRKKAVHKGQLVAYGFMRSPRGSGGRPGQSLASD